MSDRSPTDWNLPNADLALIWRLKNSVVVRLRREAGNPAPRWNLRQPHTRADPDYLAAPDGEEARAHER